MSESFSNKRVSRKKPFCAFDNLSSLSQPVKSISTSEKVIQKSVVNSDVNKNASTSQSQPLPKLTTTIEKLNDNLDSNVVESDPMFPTSGKSTRRIVNSDHIFGVFLPQILDSSYSAIQQPVLIKFRSSQLSDSGIKLPFDEYFNYENNFHIIEISGIRFQAQLIACGESPYIVKEVFDRNKLIEPSWKCLMKIKRLEGKATFIGHKPLKSTTDNPMKQILGEESLKEIFKEKRFEHGDNSGPIVTRKIISSDSCDDKIQSKKKRQESDFRERLSNIDDSTDPKLSSNSSSDDSTKDSKSLMNSLQTEIDILERKKLVLSDLDTTGSILISIISSLRHINDILSDKKKKEIELSNIVPESDKTFKCTRKNRIFLEGLIELDLDSYEFASKRATLGKPGSFAYAFIKFCFPETYFRGVTLGKKNLDKKELDSLNFSKEKATISKFPLSFIWGFKEPFEQRFRGHFDFSLGQKRVKSFIDHLFRKAGVFRYTNQDEFKVRERITKELCSRNSTFKRKIRIEHRDSESDKSDSHENFEKNGLSNEWNDCFDGLACE
ncbi:uncharacterized protein LOC128386730 [Panonychus citri]|uniref:uncharacterized protein LOC128386730 n=1 Tax=Panonychus citri TaxID=50023 RepID=UPI0023081E11|nr:uncharacterized protein LOC128386730 [Panonychus citri]